MSECNFCTFKRIKAKASLKDMKAVASERLASFGLGGVRVYFIPKNMSIKNLSDTQLKEYDSGTWFMSLPAKCEC